MARRAALLAFLACFICSWRRYAHLFLGLHWNGSSPRLLPSMSVLRDVACRARPASYGPDEYYSRKAKEEGLPARSYYKLEELDRRLSLLKPGHRVLDLGCWPGSWTLYAGEKIGPTGRVLGIDLQEVTLTLPKNCKTRVEDARQFRGGNVPELDVVLSDMAPKTMGTPHVDHLRSAQLVELAMRIGDLKLKVGGAMIAKLFDGERTRELLGELRARYITARIMRPQATRSQSYEIYLVGVGKKVNNLASPAPFEPPRRPPKQTRAPRATPWSYDGW